ncbi:MAG: AbrB family transcriptional regulator [Candidatus Aenigmarchaeota archaeon]|nr:AbrB family transcriptional regulator [Candidatus Aenigmarchaeota archaeon]
MKVVEKIIDDEGRIIIPKEWRMKHGTAVIMIELESYIKIIPNQKHRLSELFDSMEVAALPDMTDWHEFKKDIFRRTK